MRGRREPVGGWSWWAVAGLVLGLGGCFEPGGGAPNADGAADAGEPQAGAGGVGGGSRSGGAGGGPIGMPADASVAPPPFDAGASLTDEQIVCLGFDEPTCASCHTDPNTRLLVLRPSFAPPSPPDLVFTPGELAACGIDADGGAATADDAG